MQEINFYRGEYAPDQELLSAHGMGLALLAGLVLAMAAGAIQWYLTADLRDRTSLAEQQLSRTEAELKSHQATHGEPHPDSNLLAEAERQQRQVNGLRSLLERAQTDALVSRNGFTRYFEALARQAREDVWLNEIRLQAGGKEIELSGTALSSDSIPKLVKTLGREPAFQARSFADLGIKRRSQAQGVDFVLRTQPTENQAHGKP